MPSNPTLSSDGGFDNQNLVFPGVGILAAAATIAPKRLVTRITGTVPIATITPPTPYFNGPIYLVATGASVFTTLTTGNIAIASTAVLGKLLILAYDPSLAKWYPNY